MATNYFIDRYPAGQGPPKFNKAWCNPANLSLYGMAGETEHLRVCSPEWRTRIERLIERLQEEELRDFSSSPEQGKGFDSAKLRSGRQRLRKLYSIECLCCP